MAQSSRIVRRRGIDRREFLGRLAQGSAACACLGGTALPGAQAAETGLPNPALAFPGPWGFNLPKGSIILVSDQQLEDLQDPDREVDLSISSTPNRTTFRKVCQETQARGARTLILAFDHFWAQYRGGQGEKPRRLMPDTEEYIACVAKLAPTLRQHGLGLELSLLSPLELGPGYFKATGEQGRWVQYREGVRDPRTGRYEVQLWQHQRWTNNKGSIELRRSGVRAFAFRERRLGGTSFHAVAPQEIVELKEPSVAEEWEGATVRAGTSFAARRLTVRGQGDTAAGPLDRVLVAVAYATPEMDYFSPKALPFLQDLVRRYHRAGIPLNGLYADEMHIQQDWVYHGHHDEGQFALRYLTPHLARAFAAQYGPEYADLEKYLVYFAYGQHGFLATREALAFAQHVPGASPEDVQRGALLRRRYFDLLDRTVVGLFAQAKEFAERTCGHALEARAHATWAQSPTIDLWDAGPRSMAPRQYEYTSNFVGSNTAHQAASACDDYFLWNDFLTGGGNDHTEGGWLDRDYYGLALACSTGILNPVPYAYAAHWGMPGAVSERRQALVEAFGAAASPPFQAVQGSQHRDVEVLFLYPLSLVACEERFGSWMVQYGYANYAAPAQTVARGRVGPDGALELAGRRFTTIALLFEPLPPRGLLPLLETFVARGGRLIWSGPPPRLDLAGEKVLDRWLRLAGVKSLSFGLQGLPAPGEEIRFSGPLARVPAQTILTHFLVDHVYPVEPAEGAEPVAHWGGQVVGARRVVPGGGSVTFLGFRPRDDQSASLGQETRTWWEILCALDAYPSSSPGRADHPCVLSRLAPGDGNAGLPGAASPAPPYLFCRFPNGTIAAAVHLARYVESWPGGFHRDAQQDNDILARHPLPADRLELKAQKVAGRTVDYRGRLVVAFRLGAGRQLLAFAGYDCASITVDGVEHRFADRPLPLIGWAPVAEDRRVPGGAIMEIWAHGEAELRLPIPPGPRRGRLFFAGPQPGSLGDEAPLTIQGDTAVISAKNAWPARHLYLL